ncbi:hypothetical protein A1O3_07043 [Capronia epimyces CBS 606.96]|uniref:Extracellular membrane protein CFEM domain-containing protein n=1 Tax=Capronia epimyces CBS 606.96 TaxID=1182542 RepID=W9YEM9_9EURO|nr:uncharacterized protein A1O3_07043 [Capronia epimyces CBS 606.96]EXJ80759.1 hypothetical protein A1O3_07043 [Capronia epimyces CBS 606.96]
MPSSVSTSLIPLYIAASSLAGGFVHAQLGADAQSEPDWCITNCDITITPTNPRKATCKGDETGKALEKCTCDAFMANNDPMILCVQKCPEDQQLAYAKNLPNLCGKTLFPWFDLSTTPNPPAENTAAAASNPSRPTASATNSGSGSRSAMVIMPESSKAESARALLAHAGLVGYLILLVGVGVIITLSMC